MTNTIVKAAALLAIFPPSLGAVLPELSLEMIRDALTTVSKGGSESLLTPYLRFYPHRTPASVRAVQLTTPYTRLVTRAWARRNLGRYTEYDAERDYRQEGPEYLEVIVTISCGPPFSDSRINPEGDWDPFYDLRASLGRKGSWGACGWDFFLNEYQITAVFKADPARNPTPRPYGSWIMKPTPAWSSWDEVPLSAPGGVLRVTIPLASLLDPNANLEVIVSAPDGHTTEALFELSQLP